MHARNRTWPLGSNPAERCRQRTLPVEGGDGSTLSLDFTTGVLDPRLTFTRNTNATFINSQGYVEWAAANSLSNSVLAGASGATQPTGWLVSFVGGTGNFTLNGTELTISNNGSATRSRIYQTGPTGNGLFVTVQLKVVANNTSGMALVELLSFAINGAGSVTYKVNGSTQLSSFTGWVAGDTVTLTCIPTVGAAATCLFGLGASSPVSTSASVTIKDIQIEPGSVGRSYIPTTTSGAYQAPRFDYDPTTIGTPRGLLIEGSGDNQVKNSNDIYNASFWGSSVGVTATQDTTVPDPSGGTTTCKIVKSAGGQYVVRNQPLPTLTVPANSTVNLTASVWLRMDGAGQVSPHLGIYDAAGASFGTRSGATVSNSAVTIDSGSGALAAYTFGSVTGWVRCSVSRSFTNSTASPVTFTQLSIYIYPNQVNTNATTIYAWGAQVESGLGASSLIPTGASTGSRSRETLSMTGSPLTALMSQATNGFSMLVTWTPRFVYSLSGSTRYPAVAYLVKQGAATMSGTGAFWYQLGPYTLGWNAGNGTVQQDTYAPSSQANDLLRKMAWSFTNGAQLFSTNGATVTGKSLAVTNYDMNILAIGHSGSATDDGSSEGTRHYSSFKFFPTALSQTAINNLTT